MKQHKFTTYPEAKPYNVNEFHDWINNIYPQFKNKLHNTIVDFNTGELLRPDIPLITHKKLMQRCEVPRVHLPKWIFERCTNLLEAGYKRIDLISVWFYKGLQHLSNNPDIIHYQIKLNIYPGKCTLFPEMAYTSLDVNTQAVKLCCMRPRRTHTKAIQYLIYLGFCSETPYMKMFYRNESDDPGQAINYQYSLTEFKRSCAKVAYWPIVGLDVNNIEWYIKYRFLTQNYRKIRNNLDWEGYGLDHADKDYMYLLLEHYKYFQHEINTG